MRNPDPIDLASKAPYLRLVTKETPGKKAKPTKAKKRKQPKQEILDLAEKLHRAVEAYKKRHEGDNNIDVAKACGVSPSQLSNWLKDRTKPKRLDGVTYWVLRRVAETLDVSLDWLAFADPQSPIRRAPPAERLRALGE